METTTAITPDLDLVHDPSAELWYLRRYLAAGQSAQSDYYDSEAEAREALRDAKVVWHPNN
ncbi:MAG: hypothetical protein HYX87_09255 [Chloroflexi bacterium]|nr:hypothetical protein [Chloroflexota bacterium]